MIQVQPFARLGRFRNEWLNARHHFSFGQYHDPARMGVGGLRVWNDDEIAPGTGFDPHPHQEMEIVTYVREGAITHQDSLGNRGRTEAGHQPLRGAEARYLEAPGPRLLLDLRPLDRGRSASSRKDPAGRGRPLCAGQAALMAEPKHRFIVTYDVRDPGRLRRVFRELKGYGTGAQDSVFVCRLTMRQYRHLRWRLERLMVAEDSLLAVRLTPTCLWEVRGPGPLNLDAEDPSFLVL